MPRKRRLPMPAGSGLRTCLRCFKPKPLSEYRTKLTGRTNKQCNACADQAAQLFQVHNERMGRKYYFTGIERKRALRRKVVAHYGGKCACCGDVTYEFMAIDHIYGGGLEHKRKFAISGGTHLVHWLSGNNFPMGFRILCHNCNIAIKDGRPCPHETQRAAEQLTRESTYYAATAADPATFAAAA